MPESVLSLAQGAKEILPSGLVTEWHVKTLEYSPVGNICADVDHLQRLGQANQGEKGLAAFLFCGAPSWPCALASDILHATHVPPGGYNYMLSHVVSRLVLDMWCLKASEKAWPRNEYSAVLLGVPRAIQGSLLLLPSTSQEEPLLLGQMAGARKDKRSPQYSIIRKCSKVDGDISKDTEASSTGLPPPVNEQFRDGELDF